MSENREDLQKKLFTCHDIASNASNNLDKAKMALEELMNSYYLDYEPSARDAIRYGSTIGKQERDALEEKVRWSWEYILGYKKNYVACRYCL